MDENSKAQCASFKAAVRTQQPNQFHNRGLTLPKKSSRNKKRCQRFYWRRERYKEESLEEGSSSHSSSEDISTNCNDVPFRINERLRCIGFNERRPSFSDTESVLDFVKMPVGTTNSILKSSFSLTSLRSATPMDSPEHGPPLRMKTERLYHSLTKKPRKSNEQDKETWRKSWGSGISQDGKEFWEGFQADYDYLMAQNILDREVPEIQMESIPTGPPVWTHSEFMDQFAQLYSWLKGIQDLVYGKQENVTDWKLRVERQEDMERQRFRLENFNEESKKLITRYPELESEIFWRVKHINDKWETVEAMMGGWKKREGEKGGEIGSREKAEHELKCLRKWLRELDNKLKPLTFQQGWTKAELEAKTKEHMILHRDIESHRKIVSSLFRLCEQADSPNLLSAARALERKYHEYYLRSFEWQYHIESLAGLQLNKSPTSLSNDSDGEPVAKIPRFIYNQKPEDEDSDDFYALNSHEEFYKNDDWCMDTTVDVKDGDFKQEEGVREQKMVGAKESILGIGDSASRLGAKPKNTNVGFSCANSSAEPRLRENGHDKDFAQNKNSNTAVITPQPNRPVNKPPNTASFTWTHADTDSEQEKVGVSEGEGKGNKKTVKESTEGKDIETTSSEDGWTYTSGNPTEPGVQKKPKAAVRLVFKEGDQPTKETENVKQIKYFSAKNIPRSNSNKMLTSKEPISSSNKKLMDLADEFVRCKSKSWKSRRARSKKGEDPNSLDSCDASGETTTEDSEECESSEDNDGSVGTCKRSGSAEGILDETIVRAPFEFELRSNREVLRNRPWSMSSVSWLRSPRPQSLKTRSSMSESALNQMIEREFYSNKSNRFSYEDGSSGSSKKRKTKIRKRLNKKSGSGSDALTLSGSDSANRSSPQKQMANSGLVKSGSFSGVTRKQRDFSSFDKCESVTGTETDEDSNGLIPPVFRFGPTAGAVTVADPKKLTVEEQLSLNWDNYQEKYQSEAYSEEPPDSDTAKKLLEFGEDYGKFLGNLSDCPSTRSRSFTGRSKVDSDSDVDEVRRTLRQSLDQLNLWEMKFNKTIGGLIATTDEVAADDFVSKTFFDEIIGACKRNIDCLNKLLVEVKDELLLAKEHKYIQTSDAMTSVVSSFKVKPLHLHRSNGAKMVSVQVQTDYGKESWENLKATAELHKGKQLQRDIKLLKEELLNLAASVESMEMTVTCKEELEAKITQIQNELNLMKKGKNKLVQVNASVHRFLSTTKIADSTLKDEIIELYQLWDQTFCRVSSQLFNLQSLSQTWHDFEDHLSQLQCALRTDTLKVLDFALKCGTPSTDLAVSLQDIAGLLSDKESDSKNNLMLVEGGGEAKVAVSPMITALSTEGSLSDSGISDSGSEQELSEREKRLAQLKRLAKRLETILAPGSQALSNMFKRIEEAETELRELQKTCRDLIVRSATSEDLKAIVAQTSTLNGLDGELNASAVAKTPQGKKGKLPPIGKLVKAIKDDPTSLDDIDDAEGGKSGKKCWFWRLLRFSLPFQLALVALLCVACMMEPRCCDSLNNLDLSLNPQLRYDSGPPPV